MNSEDKATVAIEEAKRLEPTKDTLRELFLKSGNLCAFPACNNLMMNADGAFIGQVCHIEAALPGGERFNKQMTNDQKRSATNLMLMCYEHHIITNDVLKFPVEELKKIKSIHESKFSDPGRAMLENLRDSTNCESFKAPSKPMKFLRFIGWDTSEETLDETVEVLLEQINPFLNKFKNVPTQSRKFAGLLAHKAVRQGEEPNWSFGENKVQLLIADVQQSFNLSDHQLRDYCRVLESHGIVDVYENSDDEWCIGIKGSSDFNLLFEIVLFANENNYDIDEFTVKLNFNLLD